MPVFPLHDDAALLLQVAKGDETAFRQLFAQYWNNIYGVALAFTKSPAVAEEMVQDVFLKIWLQREKLPEVKKFDAYLFTVARNHIFNELRKKIREEAFEEHLLHYFREPADSPEERLLFKEFEQMVNKAVEQLPPQQRRIYDLSRHQGMSQEEIASTLHISKHTVKSHMNKALQVIRHYLQVHAEIETLLVIYVAVKAL